MAREGRGGGGEGGWRVKVAYFCLLRATEFRSRPQSEDSSGHFPLLTSEGARGALLKLIESPTAFDVFSVFSIPMIASKEQQQRRMKRRQMVAPPAETWAAEAQGTAS
jgi:hypothetical protein